MMTFSEQVKDVSGALRLTLRVCLDAQVIEYIKLIKGYLRSPMSSALWPKLGRT